MGKAKKEISFRLTIVLTYSTFHCTSNVLRKRNIHYARVITYLRGIPEKKWATCNLGVHSWHSSDRSPEYNYMGINSMKHLGRHLIYVALHRLEI